MIQLFRHFKKSVQLSPLLTERQSPEVASHFIITANFISIFIIYFVHLLIYLVYVSVLSFSFQFALRDSGALRIVPRSPEKPCKQAGVKRHQQHVCLYRNAQDMQGEQG